MSRSAVLTKRHFTRSEMQQLTVDNATTCRTNVPLSQTGYYTERVTLSLTV